MIVKFHNKSERIKGLSFHPKRAWLLAGLHTGNIQLWDFRLGQVIDNFEEHEGPVRSVQFHPSLSLFVSGSDDLTVRVWNYKSKKCQFVLRGHLDFVRCVNFHPELPWVISGSDDQTARVWNYQSRQMIAIVTGHSHYIMQCQFHPTQDLMITCSLDQTIRLWSISQLKKKFTSSRADVTNELELVQILEGHNQGVNWCSFHPTQNLIGINQYRIYLVSSSDDKKIKIWKYNDTRCWEIDSLSGHNNNVSSVMFHPKADVIISNSEDKTQRVWDLKKKTEVDCFTNKELDRFWVVAVHQDSYYFAAGSDSALYICTLFKDRPPMDLIGSQYLCIGYQKQIKLIDLKTQQEKLLRNLSDISNIQDNILQDNIEMLQYNLYDSNKTQIMVRLKQNQHNKSKNQSKFIVYEQQTNIVQMFLGKSAAFIGKSKVVRSKESSELEIYNYETDQHTLLNFKADRVFSFTGGKILFYTENKLLIVDPLTNQIISECICTIEFNNIKKVIYNHQMIAIQTKRGIYLFTKTLQRITSTNEKLNVKSLIFLSDAQNIVIYSTKAHLKYLLTNGDSGLLRTTENIIYLVQVQQPIDKSNNFRFIFMDNQWQLQIQMINCEELLFKQSLFDKNAKQIQFYLNNHKLLGDSLISYLYQKQYAQLAINLVTDKKAKFQLALVSNNLEVAYRNCIELKEKIAYQQLCDEAMRQGNYNIVEVCLQQLRQFDQLVFLYTLLGERDKLKTMIKIAQSQKQSDTQFSSALYLGDFDQRLQIISELKLLHNASAYVHGKQCNETLISEEDKEFLAQSKLQALIPPSPIIKMQSVNWPHNFIGEDEQMALIGAEDTKLQSELNKQDQSDNIINQPTKYEEQIQSEEEDQEEFQDCQWGLDEETLVNEQDSPQKLVPQTNVSLDFKALKYGYPDYKKQLNPSELVITEQFDQSIGVLKKQIKLESAKPLQETMKSLVLASILEISQIPFIVSSPQIVYEGESKIFINSNYKALLKLGYKQTTEGKFGESLNTFRQILQGLSLNKEKDLIAICLNYIMAMKCELNKKGADVGRQIELACYMAMCDLQPGHRQLTLRAGMSLAFKNKNYLTAAQLARNLLKLLSNIPNTKPEIVENTKKILRNSEQMSSNEYKVKFEESYLDQGILYLAGDSLTIISDLLRCPLDQAAHSLKSQLCSVCELCRLT